MDPKYNLTTFIGKDKDVLLQSGDAQNKTTVKAGLGDAKLILCYFSMHVCPPCREFTPILEELYREFNENQIDLQVIFFSGDKDQQEFGEYYAEMPWLAMPFQDPRMHALKTEFKVKGMPRLIVFKKDGSLLDDNAVENVIEEGPELIQEWLQK